LLQASDNDLDKFLGPRNPKPCLGLVLVDLPSRCRPFSDCRLDGSTGEPQQLGTAALFSFIGP
jgi:hypothetical protein